MASFCPSSRPFSRRFSHPFFRPVSPPTLPQSFQQIESWHQKIIDECGEKIAIVLVENKMDMVADSTISPEEVEALATKLCLKLYRTSCKRDINVKEVRSRSNTATHARIPPHHHQKRSRALMNTRRAFNPPSHPPHTMNVRANIPVH